MENPKQKAKEELSDLFKKLERDFNPEDEARLIELRSQYLKDPDFFREWMMYDRLVVWDACSEIHSLSEAAGESLRAYLCLKYIPEDKDIYQKELKAWKKVNGIE